MKIWDAFLQSQEEELGLKTVQKWLRTLKVLDFDAGNLYLEAKDQFHLAWFEEHIRPKVAKELVTGNHKIIKVHLSVSGKADQKKAGQKTKRKAEPPSKNPPFTLIFDELDPDCTFENFLVSETNLLPYKLLCKVTGFSKGERDASWDASPPIFNPIFIHGNSGSGKTHLLMAAASYMRKQGLNVIYVRGETFTDHLVAAIRAGEMSQFREIYRKSDMLVIDDVDIFSRKTATQEELFHTFNALHLGNKQILMSAHSSPGELQLIEPRLISRFEWGVVLPLDALKGDLMGHFLEKKSKALQFPLHSKAISFLIETFSSGTKSLQRALHALMMRSHANQAPPSSTQLSIPQIRQVLADLILEEEGTHLTPEKMIDSVAEYFGIRREDILGKAQTRDCVFPRQIAMFFCRNELKLSYAKIGQIFSRDHSTVMTSVKVIQQGIEKNSREMSSAYHAILKKLHA